MLPFFAMNNAANTSAISAESFGKHAHRYSACGVTCFNLSDYSVGKLGVVARLAFRVLIWVLLVSAAIPARASSLHVSVGDIFCIGSKKQVVWIDTASNIASVKNAEAAWYRPTKQSPCGPMGGDSAVPAANTEFSVAASVFLSGPKPTPVSL